MFVRRTSRLKIVFPEFMLGKASPERLVTVPMPSLMDGFHWVDPANYPFAMESIFRIHAGKFGYLHQIWVTHSLLLLASLLVNKLVFAISYEIFRVVRRKTRLATNWRQQFIYRSVVNVEISVRSTLSVSR